MRTRLIASVALTAVAGLTAAAPGQENRQGPSAAATAATGTAGASRAPAAEIQPDTRSLMAADGGSLLQASLPPPDAGAAANGSASGKPPAYALYGVADAEPHVLKKHDLVNIVVREESKSSMGGISNQQRQSNFDAKVDNFVKFKLASLSLYGLAGGNLPEVKLEGQRQFQGTGEYDRTDTMTTRLEAEVIDVKPNGTLVLQARRHMQIDEEEVHVTLTGVCRVQDVDATNSVLSTDMHDLRLQKQTVGQVRDTTRRGLLHQILDIINPF